MTKSNNNASSGGVSICGLLGLLFVGLKLTGYIDWSWWWVTCPFWGPFALAIAILLAIGAFMLIAALIGGSFVIGLKSRGNSQDSVKPKK